jgi:hypothetical protein
MILTVHRETLKQYITFKTGGERGKSVLLQSRRHASIPTVCADSDKIPEGETSTYILHLSVHSTTVVNSDAGIRIRT